MQHTLKPVTRRSPRVSGMLPRTTPHTLYSVITPGRTNRERFHFTGKATITPLPSRHSAVVSSRSQFGIISAARTNREKFHFAGKATITSLPFRSAVIPPVIGPMPRMLMISRRQDRIPTGNAFLFRMPFLSVVTPPLPVVPITYSTAYVGQTIFYTGANGPLRVSISRPDGGLVNAPDTMSFVARDFSGNPLSSQPLPAVLEGSGSPASTQYISAHYAMPIGAFKVEFLGVLGADETAQEIIVICSG